MRPTAADMVNAEIKQIPHNLAGEVDGRYTILAPVDTVYGGNATVYQVYDAESPPTPTFMLIPTGTNEYADGQREVHKMIAVLRKAAGRSRHLPRMLDYGTVPAVSAAATCTVECSCVSARTAPCTKSCSRTSTTGPSASSAITAFLSLRCEHSPKQGMLITLHDKGCTYLHT